MNKKLLFIAAFLGAAAGADAQWTRQDPGLGTNVSNIFNLSAPSSNVVWGSLRGLGQNPTPTQMFIKTTNGGSSWTSDTVDNAANHDFGNIFAISADTAWAAMYATTTSSSSGAIFATFDGGATWNRQTTPNQFSSPGGFPNVVYFFNGNEGIAMGDPVGGYFEIYTTTNSGNTWTRVPSANIPAPTSGEFGIVDLYSVVGNTVWFGTNKGRVFKSTNKGLNWTAATTGAKSVNEVEFKDANTGFAMQGDSLFSTTDGGATWTLMTPKGRFHSGSDFVYVPNSGTPGILVSSGTFTPPGSTKFQYGSSFSRDGGQTWYEIDDADDIISHAALAFIDSTVGYSGGFQHIAIDTNLVDQTVTHKWGGQFVKPSVLSFSINATAGPNGTITPGTTTAAYGSDQTFTFTPNAGYALDSLIVDGVRLIAQPNYTFTNVVESHSIRVTFISTLGIREHANQLGLSIFPNPGKNIVSITARAGIQSTVSLKFYDLLGRTVKTASLEAAGGLVQVSVSDLEAGSYFVEVSNGNRKELVKFIKE
jgi:photosystem II stability/assembly factor-like uncharacterized protein